MITKTAANIFGNLLNRTPKVKKPSELDLYLERVARTANPQYAERFGKLLVDHLNSAGRQVQKTAESLEKDAFIAPMVGAIRSADLTAEQKKALREYYGLDDDASLMLRNAGRGFVGSTAGGFVGGLLGMPIIFAGAASKNPALIAAGSGVSALPSIYGLIKATNKYSASNADKIIKAKKAKESENDN